MRSHYREDSLELGSDEVKPVHLSPVYQSGWSKILSRITLNLNNTFFSLKL